MSTSTGVLQEPIAPLVLLNGDKVGVGVGVDVTIVLRFCFLLPICDGVTIVVAFHTTYKLT